MQCEISISAINKIMLNEKEKNAENVQKKVNWDLKTNEYEKKEKDGREQKEFLAKVNKPYPNCIVCKEKINKSIS